PPAHPARHVRLAGRVRGARGRALHRAESGCQRLVPPARSVRLAAGRPGVRDRARRPDGRRRPGAGGVGEPGRLSRLPAVLLAAPRRGMTRTGRLAVAVAFVTLAVAFGAVYNYGSLVGEMRASLGLDASAAGWVFSVSAFAFLSSGSITGGLCD